MPFDIPDPQSLGQDAQVLRTLADPPSQHIAVTPSDTTSYSPPLRAIFCNAAGDLVVEDIDGTEATYTMLASQQISGAFTKVKAATTVSSLIGRR
jgi:hypothetical protein